MRPRHAALRRSIRGSRMPFDATDSHSQLPFDVNSAVVAARTPLGTQN
jgi:hypothetical protein